MDLVANSHGGVTARLVFPTPSASFAEAPAAKIMERNLPAAGAL
jgi:hypothetical protein